MSVRILIGDCRATLAIVPAGSVQCCVTSPPYFGLRDYGHDGQIGLEQTPEAFVAELVAVFREVRRVLADDGTLWLNLGDSYAAARGGTTPPAETLAGGVNGWMPDGSRVNRDRHDGYNPTRNAHAIGLKHKDLIGIPWRVALALQADGWWLRQDIIWHKPNPMPESVTDRCTKAHEYVFLLSKSARYYYDAAAIAEEAAKGAAGSTFHEGKTALHQLGRSSSADRADSDTRNARSVWSISTQPFKGAHFATMPPSLAERCVKAGTRPGDTVLDPFGGAGTTALVADRLGRDAILCEINPAYAEITRNRLRDDAPMLADVSVERAT